MNRQELLTKLAMELAEWPTQKSCMQWDGDNFYPTDFLDNNPFKRTEWLAERERLAAKPEAPEWDGRNVPPIGAKVLHTANDEEVKVMAHGREGKVCIGDKLGYIGIFHFSELEPIRSEEDRQIEAMARIMYECDAAGNISAREAAQALYRAGLRFPEE